MENRDTMIRDLTTGSVAKILLSFTFPILVSNALQAAYNVVDLVVAGQVLGGTGMSAVSIGGDVLHFLTFLAIGFSSAGQVIIARHIGAGERERVKKTIGTLFTLLLAISAAVAAACFATRNGILKLLNTPPESFDYTMDYMVTCIVGLPFIYGYNVVSAILRGMGDSKRPFLFIGIAAVLNIVLDILFVAFLGMEVFGAALATVIGQGASFIFSILYLYRRRESFAFDFKPASFRIDPESCTEVVRLGVPMAIQSASINFSKMVLTSWINSYGVVYSAVAGVYNKLNVVVGVISSSFIATGSAMVGQNLGAERYDRIPGILQWLGIYAVGITGIFILVLSLFPDAIFRMFTSDTVVLSTTSIIILPCILNFLGAASRSVGLSVINGSGRSVLNLAVAIIDGLVFRIGIAALLGFGLKLGCRGFWLGDALAGFMPLIIGMAFFLLGPWEKRKCEKDNAPERKTEERGSADGMHL